MKRLALAIGLLSAVAASAQSMRYLARDARLERVTLSRDDTDGGIILDVLVTKRQDDGGTNTITREANCSVPALSAAERACLVTVRTAAVACFVAAEKLP